MAGLLGEGFSAVPTTDEPSRWGPAFSQPRSLRRSPVLPCILTSLVRRYTIGENSPTDSATEPSLDARALLERFTQFAALANWCREGASTCASLEARNCRNHYPSGSADFTSPTPD